ncbi:MAG: T9SS type A sorting domain-containing protein [Cytophagaceae bacterium]|nr:T9SS type A sorting domain-containing protein [Cytophagaceae bacterium]
MKVFFSLSVNGLLLSALSVHIYPPGFSQVQITHGVANPTVYDFAPDGRVLSTNKEASKDSQSVHASYDPKKKGIIILNISGYKAKTKALVTITDLKGKKIFLDQASCNVTCERTVIHIEGKFSRGVYMIYVQIEGKYYSQKIIIS